MVTDINLNDINLFAKQQKLPKLTNQKYFIFSDRFSRRDPRPFSSSLTFFNCWSHGDFERFLARQKMANIRNEASEKRRMRVESEAHEAKTFYAETFCTEAGTLSPRRVSSREKRPEVASSTSSHPAIDSPSSSFLSFFFFLSCSKNIVDRNSVELCLVHELSIPSCRYRTWESVRICVYVWEVLKRFRNL